MSKISVLGMYAYDNTLFDNLRLPSEFTTTDRETLINNLLLECAELEVVYSNFEFFKAAIGFWSAARLRVWEKLNATLHFDYNPIWNKDGVITETRTKEHAEETSGTAASTKQAAAAKETSGSESKLMSGSNDSTTTTAVAGFNSSNFVNKDKTVTDQDWSETDTTTTRNNATENASENGSTTESGSSSGSESEEYTRTEQGNIGLTSTQQLIKEEREVSQFEIDDFIICDFKKQFCILVY